MSDENEKYYGIENQKPESNESIDQNASGADSSGEPGSGPPSPSSLDVCPNCGAPMRGKDTLLCLRCGFDLKSNKVVKTTVGKAEEHEEHDHDEIPPPESILVREGRGGLWLAEAIAGICIAALLVGYLAGSVGLFPAFEPTKDNPTVPVLVRFTELLRYLAISGIWVGCGLVALYVLAGILQKTFGDMKLALARLSAVVAAMQLATFINLNSSYENLAELPVQFAIFVALSILLFTISPKDALSLAGLTVGVFLLLCLVSFVLYWAASGSF
ncbi:MAG TPA: hypothetical protein VG711_01590 [Phycisphaerales bacterium]|nr:hypothetical protein [Phycisphaerales bacterium]